MYRLSVILRHTFFETIGQPIYPLLLVLGAATLGVFGFLPFFTLGEDTRMYKDVALDIILLVVLVLTLLATSKSIYEEIEDRTMLTLMSKPVSRWEVLVGKYLGLITASALSIVVLGAVVLAATYLRVPGDYQISTRTLYSAEIQRAHDYRMMHMAGIYPSLLLIWLQVAVLAAISVAISTKLSLVVNLPLVILVYLAGNLTRFVDSATADSGPVTRFFAWIFETIVPFLSVFDLRHLTVYKIIRLNGTLFANEPDGVFLSQVWMGAGVAFVYAALYIAAALALGMLLFRNRELGGAEG